jgi:hypothetical protein
MRCTQVVSMASARVIAGRMVLRRRANIDFPPGGPQQQVMVTTPAWPSPWHQHRERSDGVRGRSYHADR